MRQKILHTTDDTTGKLAVIWDKKCPYTTDDTTGKLQLLYGTKHVSIKQIIQRVRYSCYMGPNMSP